MTGITVVRLLDPTKCYIRKLKIKGIKFPAPVKDLIGRVTNCYKKMVLFCDFFRPLSVFSTFRG